MGQGVQGHKSYECNGPNFAYRINRTFAEFESLLDTEEAKAEGLRRALQTCHAGCLMPQYTHLLRQASGFQTPDRSVPYSGFWGGVRLVERKKRGGDILIKKRWNRVEFERKSRQQEKGRKYWVVRCATLRMDVIVQNRRQNFGGLQKMVARVAALGGSNLA